MAVKKAPVTRNKPSSKSKAKKKTGPASSKEVRIRMYNVGFGDAFLVLIPGNGKPRRILFDCGSVQAAEDVPMGSIVDQIIKDVTDDDGVPRIDVVVGTHRHKDHVSGFGNPDWAAVEVKEVWMPWTEDTSDPEARKIRDIQANLASELNASLPTTLAALKSASPELVESYISIVSNNLSLTNDKEMKTLHSGFIGEPRRRFLPTNDKDNRLITTAALPGVKIHVLGPSRERDVIRDMDPPKGQSYLRMRGAVDSRTGQMPPPFGAEFHRDSYSGAGTFSEADRVQIQQAASLSDLAVAVALDKAVNGTSLMLILEVAGTYLLFPGDAQWGTWNAVLEDPEWSDMLKNIAFYKIGHHGSHNATPKDFVEKMMPDGICAMASTLRRPVWPEIPRIPLLDRLTAKKINVARSDQPDKISSTFVLDQGVIETRIAL